MATRREFTSVRGAMGWGFRRSKKVGPFQVSLSKGGVGVSAGVGGLRAGVGPRGAYASASAGGVNYRSGYAGGRALLHAPKPASNSGCLGAFITFGLLFITSAIMVNGSFRAGLIFAALCIVSAITINILIARSRRLAQAAYEQQQQQLAAEAYQQRWIALCQRFGEVNARRILDGRPWQGADADMIVATLGPPADVDESVMKTKTKHVFKYFPMGGGRFALRVNFEDGLVVGWDDKR